MAKIKIEKVHSVGFTPMIPVTPAFAMRVASLNYRQDYDEMCEFVYELRESIIAFDEDDEDTQPQDEQGKEEDLD